MADSNARDTDPTTKPQDEEAEWRGGAQAQERGDEERSGERGWGTPNADDVKEAADETAMPMDESEDEAKDSTDESDGTTNA